MEPRFTMYELTHTIYIKYNQPDGILRKLFLTEDSTLPTAIHWLTAVKIPLQTSTDSNVNGMWWQFCPELISGTLKVSMLPFQFGSSHPLPRPSFFVSPSPATVLSVPWICLLYNFVSICIVFHWSLNTIRRNHCLVLISGLKLHPISGRWVGVCWQWNLWHPLRKYNYTNPIPSQSVCAVLINGLVTFRQAGCGEKCSYWMEMGNHCD